jgi:hypothetical protein
LLGMAHKWCCCWTDCLHACSDHVLLTVRGTADLVRMNASANFASVDTAVMSSSTAAALVLMGLWG